MSEKNNCNSGPRLLLKGSDVQCCTNTIAIDLKCFHRPA